MRDISIFARMPRYQRTYYARYPHIIRGSSVIRGIQVAEHLGCKLNPESGYENDVCIHVKPNDLDAIKDGDWVDVVDSHSLRELLIDRPEVNVITVSELVKNMYSPVIKNQIVVIEPHHCNFDRDKRIRQEITTVGYIGSYAAFGFDFEEMKKMVEGVGLNFIYSLEYRSREDVVDFYKQIDIQLVYAHRKVSRQSIGPTKAINAASFGIPTVAYPQVCYQEIEGKYIKAGNFDQLLDELKKLKDREYYESWATKVDWTEKYHISERAKLYKELT